MKANLTMQIHSHLFLTKTACLAAGLLLAAGAAQAQTKASKAPEPTVSQILATAGAYTTTSAGHTQNTFLVSTQTFSFADVSVVKLASYAGDTAETTFGYYSASNPSTLNTLWTDTTPNGTTKTFTPSTEPFGFFIDNTAKTGGTFFTQTSLNSDGAKQVDVYQNITNGDYYLAFEDEARGGISSKTPSGNPDFNDLVVQVQAVPEASTTAGFLLGGVVLMALAYRQRRQRSTALDLS